MCTGTVTECESVLAQQKANDLAEAKRVEEELKLKEEMVRRAVEQEEKERQERLRVLLVYQTRTRLFPWACSIKNFQQFSESIDTVN